MFESLSQRLGDTFRKLSGRGRISQDNVRDSMRDVRTALAHLRRDPRVDGSRPAVVGASYSGE